MIDIELVVEILATYKKHGWILSRVLLSEVSKPICIEPRLSDDLRNCEIVGAKFDAAWFSRPARNKMTALELRHLSEKPFAIFDLIASSADRSELTSKQNEMEHRMSEHTTKPPPDNSD